MGRKRRLGAHKYGTCKFIKATDQQKKDASRRAQIFDFPCVERSIRDEMWHSKNMLEMIFSSLFVSRELHGVASRKTEGYQQKDTWPISCKYLKHLSTAMNTIYDYERRHLEKPWKERPTRGIKKLSLVTICVRLSRRPDESQQSKALGEY